jgi:hypothetical protein
LKYPEFQSDEWMTPDVKNFKVACCDCGLVHRVKFRVEAGLFQLKMSRDNRATAAMRRHKRRTKGA